MANFPRSESRFFSLFSFLVVSDPQKFRAPAAPRPKTQDPALWLAPRPKTQSPREARDPRPKTRAGGLDRAVCAARRAGALSAHRRGDRHAGCEGRSREQSRYTRARTLPVHSAWIYGQS